MTSVCQQDFRRLHQYGFGTLFKTNADGSSLAVAYSFGKDDGIDGIKPFAELVQTSNGKIYGATTEGGLRATESSSNMILAQIHIQKRLTSIHPEQFSVTIFNTLVRYAFHNFHETSS